MDAILTPAQVTARKRQGWQVLSTTFDESYKSQWNTPWFFIREIMQNALDEHDEAGVTSTPVLDIGSSGAYVEDSGRGIGASAMLMRETKSVAGDLRGRFGEGLKYACITALRMGYVPLIESPALTVEAHFVQQSIAGQEVKLLTFLWKESATPRKGTKITIQGYRGNLYKDRFVQFLGAPLAIVFQIKGRFKRNWSLFKSPSKRVYVGDIFLRDIQESTPFSYALWGINLNPDRISEISGADLHYYCGWLWDNIAKVGDSTDLLTDFLRSAAKAGTFEGKLRFSASSSAWLKAWRSLYGEAVLYTDDMYKKLAEGYGYKVVGVGWSQETRSGLRSAIPTDESIVSTRVRELKPVVVSDDDLRPVELKHLKLMRWLASNWPAAGRDKPDIFVANIPRDPRTGDGALGLFENLPNTVFLSRGIMSELSDALSTFFHEMGHWLGGSAAVDASVAHIKAIQEVASRMSLLFYRNPGKVDEILGVKVSAVTPVRQPIAQPVAAEMSTGMKVLDMDRRYSLSELQLMSWQQGLSNGGNKHDIIRRLLIKGVQ